MKLRVPQMLLIVSALAAFAPILAVDWLLDGYVAGRESQKLRAELDQVTRETEAGVASVIRALRRIEQASPVFCSPAFLAAARAEMLDSLVIRQIVVTNDDGIQLCDAIGTEFSWMQVSSAVPMPGHTETLTVVGAVGRMPPSLLIETSPRDGRRIGVFIPVHPHVVLGPAGAFPEGSFLRMELTNGQEISTYGDAGAYERATARGEFITAESFAGQVPIRGVAAVPFASVRMGYADLDIGFTMVACLMSAAFLWLALQYVRRGENPAHDLEKAIARGQLRPRYQPVVNLLTGRIAGCEVLIRWDKPSGETVSPGAFIEYAEMSGLAIPMTLSLMEQVRDDLEPLCGDQPDLKVSINLFEGHFRDGSIVEDVVSIFDGSKVGYGQLVFEITERQPLSDKRGANATITALHRLGSRVALDDAGTGHSNLAYLQELGIDIIKIDKVFIDLIKQRTDTVPVVDALISMARDLKIDIIAEGVETLEQALYLKAKGVIYAQGYLFAPALFLGPFIELARRMNRAPAPDTEGEAAASAA